MARGLFGRVLPLFSLAAVLAVTLAACGGSGGGGGGGGGGGEDVSVASDIAYPPFEFEKNGEPVGFDIDLMDEIGKRAGFTPEYQNVGFDGIIGGLANNQYDLVISAMTITPERQKRIDFSDPYFNADQSLLVPSDSDIGSVDEIGDATVGVQIGTTGEIKANEFEEQGEGAHAWAWTGGRAARVASRRDSRGSGHMATRAPSTKTSPASQTRFTSGLTNTLK